MSNDRLLISSEVSQLLRVSVSTLASWRQQKRGPAFHRVGNKALYRESDVRAWLKSHRNAGNEAA
jgi:excisionase family DNA binding protein